MHPAAGEAERGGYWRVAVVEDHLLQRRRTEEVVRSRPGLRVVHSCEDLQQLSDWLAGTSEAERPHVVILDLVVDRGVDADPAVVRGLVRNDIRVLVLSAMTSVPLVREMMRAGVSGFVGKRDSEDDIVAAVWTVIGRGSWMTPEMAAVMAGDAGRPPLSDQEERALVLYASGLTLESVARALGVKKETAKTYLDRVKAKYTQAGRPVQTKIDLHREAVRDGILPPADRSTARRRRRTDR